MSLHAVREGSHAVMNPELATDPVGDYSVDEVTLAVACVPMRKGAGATGAFVRVGPKGTPFRLARRVTVTLLRTSPFNEVLRSWRDQGTVVSVAVERIADGRRFLGRSAFVEEHSPRGVGREECEWVVIGGLEPTAGADADGATPR